MTRDSVVLGLLAGFAGNIVKELIVWPLHFLGYVRYTFAHIAAGYFVPSEFLDNPVSLVTGAIADWSVAGGLGVLLLQLIRRTGHDYAIVKGLAFGAATYVLLFGPTMSLDMTRASLLTPLPNLVLFFPHIAFGASAGWFIDRFDKVEA